MHLTSVAYYGRNSKNPPFLAWLEAAMVDEPEDSLVVFQLLDSSLFLARTEDGGLSPAKRGQDGIYHVEGESTLAPEDFQYGVFQMIRPLIDAVGNRNVIIISPIPRFMQSQNYGPVECYPLPRRQNLGW